jgi:hypothetical protein
MKEKYQLVVELNGTDVNPWHRWGLSQNPFPQIGKYEYDRYVHIVQSLAGDPIPNTDYIREKLKGFHPAFIELCCKHFKKGETTSFYIEWEE